MKSQQKTIMIIGGDGYLGWSLSLAFGNRTDYRVVIADNMIKREWEKEVNAKLLAPFPGPDERIAEYERIFKKKNILFEKLELLDERAIVTALKKYKPSVIINAAQQPSAPFSMMNAKNAAVTFSNNIVGHMNVLWAIAEVDRNITYIKLGSAGCYMDVDTDFLPLEKKDFTFEHEGKVRSILNSWFPMQATDFYHQSKVSDFLINDLCAKIWGLKIITVQQATIFGATIPENRSVRNAGLSTRFNYDAIFGTILNRFVCQLAIGHPLTVYGNGSQTTGLISLSDTVDNFLNLVKMKLKAGEHTVVHNYTDRYSIKELAVRLAKMEKAEIQYLPNPRKESDGKMKREVEMHSAIKKHIYPEKKLQEELSNLFLFAKRYKDNIDTSLILPTVTWDKAGQLKTAARPDKIFFNHGAVGFLSEASYRAASSFLDEYYRVGPPEALLKYEAYTKELSKEIAILLNCSAEEITHIQNTTEGISIATESLPLEKGDEVLVLGNEYPGALLPWLKKRKEGITVTLIKGRDNKKAFASLLNAISLKTKAISISSAQYYDGFMPDLETLSKLCAKKGIFLVIDAVQSIGARRFDLKKISADIVVCGAQKYVGGLPGIGFMYVNKNTISKLKDSRVGMRSMKSFDDTSYILKTTAERFETGTQNLIGIVALHAAIKEINETGIEKIEQKNLRLLKAFKKCLKDNGIRFIDHENQGNIISLKIFDPQAFTVFLRNNNIYIKAIKDVARISFANTSSLDEFKILVEKAKEWQNRRRDYQMRDYRLQKSTAYADVPSKSIEGRVGALRREIRVLYQKLFPAWRGLAGR